MTVSAFIWLFTITQLQWGQTICDRAAGAWTKPDAPADEGWQMLDGIEPDREHTFFMTVVLYWKSQLSLGLSPIDLLNFMQLQVANQVVFSTWTIMVMQYFLTACAMNQVTSAQQTMGNYTIWAKKKMAEDGRAFKMEAGLNNSLRFLHWNASWPTSHTFFP